MVMNLEVVDSLSSLKVSDAMSTDVVQGTVSEPLSEAVTRMLDRDVGCIVITENGKIQGVITKGDALRRAFLLGLDAREVSCKRAMTQPVFSIDPETRIEDAAKLMGD